jgi:murein DD-endopeptidase MepM/ murein hydrolase activator NlpD
MAAALIAVLVVGLCVGAVTGVAGAARGLSSIHAVSEHDAVAEMAALMVLLAGNQAENGDDTFENVQGIECDPLAGVPATGMPAYGWPLADGIGDVQATYCDAAYEQQFGKQHWGLDLAAPEGTGVLATMSGTVARAAYDDQFGMGWNVKICDDAGWCAIYEHLLEQPMVSQGEWVSAGQEIGRVGSSGQASGAHLHYQINAPGGLPVDPWLTVGR